MPPDVLLLLESEPEVPFHGPGWCDLDRPLTHCIFLKSSKLRLESWLHSIQPGSQNQGASPERMGRQGSCKRNTRLGIPSVQVEVSRLIEVDTEAVLYQDPGLGEKKLTRDLLVHVDPE